MLITDKNELKKYYTPNRLWQGIPGIEVTKKGRIFITFYSGETKETIGNYALLIKSDDGANFSEPIAVTFLENHRCYDPTLWIDPLGRLWFSWAVAPSPAVYASVCDDPDADELKWSEPKILGKDVMMNKPTVLSTGEWMFPITVWDYIFPFLNGENPENPDEIDRRAFVYRSLDNGMSFKRYGGIAIEGRSFDEHMILELSDGTLAMYIRTYYGIGVSYSYDRGKTWTAGENSGLGGPDSRFFIRRLKSGRILLINHYDFKGRNNLTAMLSEDDGKTWPYKLLLDERNEVSYPDACEADGGYIYITYDRERGSFLKTLEEVYSYAREILIAKITEEDIINGKISGGSRLKQIASKLGKYANECESLYNGTVLYNKSVRYTDLELTRILFNKNGDEIITYLFDHYQINCLNMHWLDNNQLDSLIEQLQKPDCKKYEILLNIISLIRSVTDLQIKEVPIVERIKSIVKNDWDISVKNIAEKLGISQYYMCHVFKKTTGITIVDYKNELKITTAKDMLINSDKKITDISYECGFSSDSYFSKIFTASEKLSPTQYRKLLKITYKNN